MTLVLWGISNNEKRSRQMTTNNTMLSLNEYYDIAKRCIGAFAGPSSANSMLKNEDAISFVAEHLMYGSANWNPDRGRTLRSYLNQCAIWSIQRWFFLLKRAKKHDAFSLNKKLHCDSDKRTLYLYETIADEKAVSPDEALFSMEECETIHKVLKTASLTPRQQQCVELVYIENYSGVDAAKKLGVSRQAVDYNLHQAISKIRGVINGNFREGLAAR